MYRCIYVCTDVRSCQHQKVNLRSLLRTQWPIFVKLVMWVVGGTSITHAVFRHRMHIFNTCTSFAYLFWLANIKKVKYPECCMGYIDGTWYVGSDAWAQVLAMRSVVIECAYSIPHLHICSDCFITKNQISGVLCGLHWWNLVCG